MKVYPQTQPPNRVPYKNNMYMLLHSNPKLVLFVEINMRGLLKISIATLSIGALLFSSSCKKNDDEMSSPFPRELSGAINSDTDLENVIANQDLPDYLVVGDLTVNASLTIGPRSNHCVQRGLSPPLIATNSGKLLPECATSCL